MGASVVGGPIPGTTSMRPEAFILLEGAAASLAITG